MAEVPQSDSAAAGRELLEAAEAQLQRLQCRATAGWLAAGIAHEFNNLLLAIRGNLALAAMAPETSETARTRLDQADTAAARASELSQRLMALARPMARGAEAVDFNRVAEEAAALATRAWRGKITMTVQPAVEPAPVWMEFSTAMQMVLNLCLNAGEAIPQATGGRVTITNEVAGPTVRCTVADNGSGIAAEAMQKLFTPFFTTKPHGAGLGLALSQAAALRAGGRIEAENRAAGGAAFTIVLPRHEELEVRKDRAEKSLDAPGKML